MNTSLTRRSLRNRAALPSIFSVDPFGALRDEFDQMLSKWFSDTSNDWQPMFSPSLDLTEVDGNYQVQFDLPGLSPGDINVQLSDNVLTVSGERSYETPEAKEKEKKSGSMQHVVERFHGKFSRSVVLPGAVMENKIDAQFRDGVLTITLPKAEEPKPLQIKIKP